jgi:SagB-type dehydrogenase family enzyme
VIHRYHDGTKHLFERHARSLGYLDWASRPDLFRSFLLAREIPLPPRPDAAHVADLHEPLTAAAIGDVLRHALGLSAWKRTRDSGWPLRVNPSSGNLHPTEAYVVCGPAPGIAATAGVYHYAADRHAIEERSAFAAADWTAAVGTGPIWFVALTSIHWREAWKYGERAFRYCQHDLGHAIAAVGIAAALAGWRAALAPEWPHRDIAALTGIDRDDDYVDAEREEPGCLLRVERPHGTVNGYDREALLDAVRRGHWTGHASQLSEDHVQWTFIDDIARATEDPGREAPVRPGPSTRQRPAYTRELILQRRSAVALDGRSSIGADRFVSMLARLVPTGDPPWDAIWWDARIHLALFVHRVDGVEPGLYLLVRHPRAIEPLKAALMRDFAWTPATRHVPLFQLARGDARRLADRLSCDQDIAADGFFSLGMIAEFDASLESSGAAFYRHLFWESGIVGQVLYLEAEAAGARGTGIGCFYDDPVHDVLGISGHAFQSLYHFAMGMPVEDSRLTTEPGYAWEHAEPIT